LAFAGSARKGSFNDQLVRVAASGAQTAGTDVTVINLRDYPLPIMDEDLEREQGTPQNALNLKQLFLEHDGLLISSPEYNSSLSPLLKNAIDWVSRPAPDEARLAAYRDKVSVVMAASPGGLGGMRGLVHLRAILSNLGVLVLPEQIAVSNAASAFDDGGVLNDAKQQARIEGLGKSLADVLTKLRG